MKSARGFSIVLSTAPSLALARGLERPGLKSKLAACVNLVPRLESHYWWKGALEKSSEILMIIKTSNRNLAALEEVLRTGHPYDTPEILSLRSEEHTSELQSR